MKRGFTLFQILLLLVFAVCAVYLCVAFYRTGKTENNMRQLQEQVNTDTAAKDERKTETVPEEARESNGMLSRYFELYSQNTDMTGWVKIDGTSINYPVMQSTDNDYYLHRDFYGNYSQSGVPFLDWQCVTDGDDESEHFIIYAHNMHSGAMFSDLLAYKDKSFFEQHRYISFDTMYERYTYEIFAVFRTSVGSENEFRYYDFVDAPSRRAVREFIEECKSRSLYETGVATDGHDRLLTLSTCSYNTDNERFAVVARRLTK